MQSPTLLTIKYRDNREKITLAILKRHHDNLCLLSHDYLDYPGFLRYQGSLSYLYCPKCQDVYPLSYPDKVHPHIYQTWYKHVFA